RGMTLGQLEPWALVQSQPMINRELRDPQPGGRVPQKDETSVASTMGRPFQGVLGSFSQKQVAAHVQKLRVIPSPCHPMVPKRTVCRSFLGIFQLRVPVRGRTRLSRGRACRNEPEQAAPAMTLGGRQKITVMVDPGR